MFSPPIRRLAAWLCLLASLWMALTPARSLVLCVEADGCVSLEVVVAGRCEGCADRCAAHAPVPAAEPCCEGDLARAIDGGDADAAVTSAADDCPCVDIALPGANNDRLRPRSLQPHVPPAAVAPIADVILLSPPVTGPRLRLTPLPRPPSMLAQRAAVVLLV
jgi:hypothetical protein